MKALAAVCLGVVSVALGSPAAAQENSQPCGADARASLALEEGENTTFVFEAGDTDGARTLQYEYSGCDLPAEPVEVDLSGLRPSQAEATGILKPTGDGVAFVELDFAVADLRSGTQNPKLVISGENVVTSVTPLTIKRQYDNTTALAFWGLLGVIGGIAVAIARARLAGDPWEPKYVIALVLAAGASWPAFASAYLNDEAFEGNLASLAGLTIKIGAAVLAAATLTATATAGAQAVAKARNG